MNQQLGIMCYVYIYLQIHWYISFSFLSKRADFVKVDLIQMTTDQSKKKIR